MGSRHLLYLSWKAIQETQAKRRALENITNTNHATANISAMLPFSENSAETSFIQIVEDEIPPCCYQPFQNVHPALTKYEEGPTGDGFMSYACLTAIINDEKRTVEFCQHMGVVARYQTCREVVMK